MRVKKTASSERAEAMPAAIITSIVSSLLLLGIASAVSLVVQDKADAEGNTALTTVASNIDVSLRSDITQASYISAAAKLKQPATTRLLAPTDLLLSGVNMHVPASSGECKVVRWNINGSTASRELTIYQNSTTTDTYVKCDETSPVVAKRTKVFAQNVNVQAPFKFHNQVGRELTFTTESAALTTVNAELDRQLTAKGVQKLSDTDFNELNKLMGTGSYVAGFGNPDACVMDATKVNNVCPAPEAETVTAAWNSLKIAKVSVNFQMQSEAGETAQRDIAQNSSVPLYGDAAEAQASVASSSLDNRPSAPVINLSAANVILGTNYTINWTAGGACPVDMIRSYKLYENNVLLSTQTTATLTKNFTNSAVEYVNYRVQTECVRGALVVSSDMSNVATAKVIPAVPVLTINQQPPLANAALTAPLQATANCLYGTTATYNIRQIQASYGPVGTAVLNVPSVNRPINGGFQVVEGARYQYQIDAWCVSAYDRSATTNRSTNTFTTLINTPATPNFTSPAANATDVPPTLPVVWSAVTCPVGTIVKYFAGKTVDGGAPIGMQIIRDWTSDLDLTPNNTQGNTVGFAVQSRCEGTAGINSNPSAPANLTYTTLIDSPAATAFSSPVNGATNVAPDATVTWDAVVCAPGTVAEYYTTKNLEGGVGITPVVIDNWTTNLSLISSNAEGTTVGYTAEARCSGPNVNSVPSPTTTLQYTTLISAPAAPTFTSPADNATGVTTDATVSWTPVTCATGTTAEYYVVKTINGGVALSPWPIIENWTTNLSFVSGNTQGNRVSYSVAARCVGPSAISPTSAPDALTYTTTIAAPNAVTFTFPADNATAVHIWATLTWTPVTCAAGTTAKYYSTKNYNMNVAITPIVIENWTADVSSTTNNSQGYNVGYTVRARCDGPNAVSASTATDSLRYTTAVNMPSAVTAGNNGNNTVTWVAPATGCAPEAPISFRVNHVKSNNNVVDINGAWLASSDRAEVLPGTNTGGYPQWAHVEAYCNGVNADSAIRPGANVTKWVKTFAIAFSANRGEWRRINIAANCPVSTTLGAFYIYVAADGWGGGRTDQYPIQTDEGYWIAGAFAGPGGNSGWISMTTSVNTQWNDVLYDNTTGQWGYWGNGGWGGTRSGNDMTGTYWNAAAWGTFRYLWYGSCSTPYMLVADKGIYTEGTGSIGNYGTPDARWNSASDGVFLTSAGTSAIQ